MAGVKSEPNGDVVENGTTGSKLEGIKSESPEIFTGSRNFVKFLRHVVLSVMT